MSDDDRLEVDVNRLIDDLAVSRPPDAPLERALAATSRTRPLPRWLALVMAPPMRTGSVLRAGSPAMRLVAIAITLAGLVALTMGAIAGGTALLGPSALVVAQDGSGDYETISAAVADARDGDRIEVMPGRYVEDVQVDGKDLTIVGIGDRKAIVLAAAPASRPADAPPEARDRLRRDYRGAVALINRGDYARALLLRDTASTISNLTLTGQAEGSTIEVVGSGADPTLIDLDLPFVGDWQYDHAAIWWTAGAGGVLRDSDVVGSIEIDTGATPTLQHNRLEACITADSDGTHLVLEEQNVLSGCPFGFLVAFAYGENSAHIVDNDFSISAAIPDLTTEFQDYAVWVWRGNATTLWIEGNRFHDSRHGINLSEGVSATVQGNTFERHATAIVVESADVLISDNEFRDTTEQAINAVGSPAISGNAFLRNPTAIAVGRASAATITGNTFCQNDIDIRPSLFESTAPTPPVIEDNTSCPDDTG